MLANKKYFCCQRCLVRGGIGSVFFLWLVMQAHAQYPFDQFPRPDFYHL